MATTGRVAWARRLGVVEPAQVAAFDRLWASLDASTQNELVPLKDGGVCKVCAKRIQLGSNRYKKHCSGW